MTEKDSTIYQAKFTAGGLLLKECDWAIPFSYENGVGMAHVLRDNPKYLGTDSLASRIRIIREIHYSYTALDPKVWMEYGTLPLRSRAFFPYIACLLAFPILRNFHFRFVVRKWKELATQVTLSDAQKLLDEVSAQHPEIKDWTESTQAKMGTVVMWMLEESKLFQHFIANYGKRPFANLKD